MGVIKGRYEVNLGAAYSLIEVSRGAAPKLYRPVLSGVAFLRVIDMGMEGKILRIRRFLLWKGIVSSFGIYTSWNTLVCLPIVVLVSFSCGFMLKLHHFVKRCLSTAFHGIEVLSGAATCFDCIILFSKATFSQE